MAAARLLIGSTAYRSSPGRRLSFFSCTSIPMPAAADTIRKQAIRRVDTRRVEHVQAAERRSGAGDRPDGYSRGAVAAVGSLWEDGGPPLRPGRVLTYDPGAVRPVEHVQAHHERDELRGGLPGQWGPRGAPGVPGHLQDPKPAPDRRGGRGR